MIERLLQIFKDCDSCVIVNFLHLESVAAKYYRDGAKHYFQTTAIPELQQLRPQDTDAVVSTLESINDKVQSALYTLPAVPGTL